MTKRIVITGGTRGIGRGLADAFLDRGCSVAVTGTSSSSLDEGLGWLADRHPSVRIAGFVADVTDVESLRRVWAGAVEAFGGIDVWINNAGISLRRAPIWDQEAEDIRRVLDVNLYGTMAGSHVAIVGMLEQGHGQVWLMEGFGSDGRSRAGMAAYGASKRSVRYLVKALGADVDGTAIQVNAVSPGMVVTDLLVGDYEVPSPEWDRARRIFNILGDRVDTVAPSLADRILATDRSGARVAWLTTPKVIARFAAAPFRKRDLFADQEPAREPR